MIIKGECVLIPHNFDRSLMIVANDFSVAKGAWVGIIKAGSVINGASIPFPFTLWLDKYDPDYIIAAVIHDCLCGEHAKPIKVADSLGNERQLTWKESAVWFREAMKLNRGNHKLIRRVFYHAVMLVKRIGK